MQIVGFGAKNSWDTYGKVRRNHERLAKGIAAVFEESRQTYGVQRVYRALRDRGIYSSQKRVARLMRREG